MAIRTLLYDLGNVLVHFSHARMYDQIGAVCGRNGQDVRTFLERGLMVDYEEGRLTDVAFHAQLEAWAERKIDGDALRTAGSDIFWLNESMQPILDAVQCAGLRLVLLSNTSRAHIDHVRSRWNVLDRFDAVVLSFEVGATKPNEAIYRAAIEQIACEPAECFYTDDIPAFVDVGRRLGLNAEVFVDAATHIHQLRALGVLAST